MNIFHKVAFEGLKKSRTRTVVTIIGVILSAAMITGVTTFGVSLLDYLTEGAMVKYGDWQVAFSDVDKEFVEDLSKDSRVEKESSFQNIGYALLDGGQNPDKPYLFIAGFDEVDEKTLPIKMLTGRMPETSDEILVSSSVESNGGVKYTVGDTISLEVGDRMSGNNTLSQNDSYSYEEETFRPAEQKQYKVVGIYQRPAFEQYTAPGYTLITKIDKNTATDSHSLYVTLKKPMQTRSFAQSVSKEDQYFLNDNVLRFMGISDDHWFNSLLYTIGGIVIVIIMVGSVFLIYNSFHISLNERIRQFGILQSVGATSKQLRNMVLFEGTCIGAVGIPIGIFVGIGCIGLVITVVAKNFGKVAYDGVPLKLVISVPALVAAIVVSFITILISAYIPAKKATRIPIMECIRQTNEVKLQAKSIQIGKLSRHIYGLEGTLALKNFKRNKKQYRSIVLSLVLSVVLFITVNSFVSSFKQLSSNAVVFSNYDICLSTPDMGDDQMKSLFDQIKNVEGAYDCSYQLKMPFACTANTNDLTETYLKSAGITEGERVTDLSVSMQFLDNAAYSKIVQSLGLSTEEYMARGGKLLAVAKVSESDEKVDSVEDCPDVFNKDTMSLSIAPKIDDASIENQAHDVNVSLVSIVPPDALPLMGHVPHSDDCYTFTILAPYSMKEEFVAGNITETQKGMTLCSKDCKKTAAGIQKIVDKADLTDTCRVYNMYDMTDESRNYLFIANVFAYTFIIMITLIAVANVFNTISTNIKMRRRELAMLRSVGMSEKAFQRMMNIECAFFGGKALLIGIPLAIAASALMYYALFCIGEDEINFTMPWACMGISIVGVLFIVFITMLYSINEIKKENIIDALRDDME